MSLCPHVFFMFLLSPVTEQGTEVETESLVSVWFVRGHEGEPTIKELRCKDPFQT